MFVRDKVQLHTVLHSSEFAICTENILLLFSVANFRDKHNFCKNKNFFIFIIIVSIRNPLRVSFFINQFVYNLETLYNLIITSLLRNIFANEFYCFTLRKGLTRREIFEPIRVHLSILKLTNLAMHVSKICFTRPCVANHSIIKRSCDARPVCRLRRTTNILIFCEGPG